MPVGFLPIFLLALFNVVNYLDRYVIAAIGPSLQRDALLNDGQFGLLGAAFVWGYLMVSPFVGSWARKVSRPVFLSVCVAFWSVMMGALTAVSGVVMLMVARILMGVGQAGYTVVAPTVLDDLTEKKTKSKWFALFYAAVPVGCALGFVYGGWMDGYWGWQRALTVAMGVGIFLSPLLLMVRVSQAETKPIGAFAGMREIERYPRYVWTVLGYAMQTFALGGLAFWAPTFLYRVFDLPAAFGSMFFGGVVVVTGVTGSFLGGYLNDRAKGIDKVSAALRLCWLLTALSVPFAVACVFATSPWVFFVMIGIAQVAIFATVPLSNLVFIESVPSALRATALGMAVFVGSLLGDMISIPLVGGVSDAVDSLRIGMLMLPMALLLNAVLWLIASRVRAK